MTRSSKTAYIAKIAMLSVLAYIIQLLEFSIPIFPSFLQFDFSDLIGLVTSLALGPVAGILVELIKNLIRLFTVTHTAGVGELANFVVGAAFVAAAGGYYKFHKTKRGAMISLAFGVLAMIIAGGFINYFVSLPLYDAVLGMSTEMIIAWSAEIIPAINSKLTLILYAFCPFNLIKGVALSAITIPLYKHISPLLKKESFTNHKNK